MPPENISRTSSVTHPASNTYDNNSRCWCIFVV